MFRLRPIRDWPSSTLLQLAKGHAYAFWCLGAVLGIVTVIPRVQELKGQPAEDLTVFGVTGMILLLTLGCLFTLSRLTRELERRLDQSEH